MVKPVLIVSTGRCGSTMMSEVVRLHPEMLSVSELFSTLFSNAFLGDRLTGEAFSERLRKPSPLLARLLRDMVREDVIPGEIRHRFGGPGRRAPEETPPILLATLPLLTSDPEPVLEELLAALDERGEDTLASHYRFLLDWLRERFDRRVWVERSGTSLRYVPVLARLFPDARFVHLCRDGRDCALSMQRQMYFRLQARHARLWEEAGEDPFRAERVIGVDPFGPFLERQSAQASDEDLYSATADPADLAWFWNGMIEQGLDYLDEIAPERILTLRLEDIVGAPREELRRFARFVGEDFDDPDWIEAAAAIPRSIASQWRDLPPEEREALHRACLPGLKRLGYLDAGA